MVDHPLASSGLFPAAFGFPPLSGLLLCLSAPSYTKMPPSSKCPLPRCWLHRKLPELPCQYPKAPPPSFDRDLDFRALVSIVVCAAFLVYITISYFMSLKLHLTTNMIPVTETMIVQVYKRPQNACLVTLTCLQHPLCPLAGVRMQNPCMQKARSHLDTPTKAAVDIMMCPQVVRGVYLGAHMPL